MTVKTEAMLCKGCGATLPFDGTQLVVTCEYCGARNAIEDAELGPHASLLKKAQIRLKKGDIGGAIECYREVAEEDPLNAELWYKIIELDTNNFTARIYSYPESSYHFLHECEGAMLAELDQERVNKIAAYVSELRDLYEEEVTYRNTLKAGSRPDPNRELAQVSNMSVQAAYTYFTGALKELKGK